VSNCQVCDAQTSAFLCARCTAEIERALAELPADLSDLQAVATRQAAGPLGLGDPARQWDGPRQDGALGDTGWVFAPGAADQLWVVGNTVTTWARHLASSRGVELPAWVADARTASRWLLSNLDAIRHDEAAAQIHDEITSLPVENERWIVGRPSRDQFYGVCDAPDVRSEFSRPSDAPVGPRCYGLTSCGHESCDAIRTAEREPVIVTRASTCGADLYGQPDAERVRCQACGRTYATKDRRDEMRTAIPDQLGTIPEVAAALSSLDRPVHVEALNSAVRRGQVAVRGHGPRSERLVRVGDVEAWLNERDAKATKRRNITAA
jgi:hypothetical protein